MPLDQHHTADQPARRVEPLSYPTTDALAGLLVTHGIVDPCAVEDPEGYDHERTLNAIACAAAELRERLSERRWPVLPKINSPLP